nr:hypothetical protein GCM10020092_069730 [Actinoplanes digitatis]
MIGPFGVGALKLGMNRKQAEATGLITKWVASAPAELLGHGPPARPRPQPR